jgi:hypothetical protein
MLTRSYQTLFSLNHIYSQFAYFYFLFFGKTGASTILHNKLKCQLFQIIDNCFLKQKWNPEIQISCDWEAKYTFCDTPF